MQLLLPVMNRWKLILATNLALGAHCSTPKALTISMTVYIYGNPPFVVFFCVAATPQLSAVCRLRESNSRMMKTTHETNTSAYFPALFIFFTAAVINFAPILSKDCTNRDSTIQRRSAGPHQCPDQRRHQSSNHYWLDWSVPNLFSDLLICNTYPFLLDHHNRKTHSVFPYLVVPNT